MCICGKSWPMWWLFKVFEQLSRRQLLLTALVKARSKVTCIFNEHSKMKCNLTNKLFFLKLTGQFLELTHKIPKTLKATPDDSSFNNADPVPVPVPFRVPVWGLQV